MCFDRNMKTREKSEIYAPTKDKKSKTEMKAYVRSHITYYTWFLFNLRKYITTNSIRLL